MSTIDFMIQDCIGAVRTKISKKEAARLIKDLAVAIAECDDDLGIVMDIRINSVYKVARTAQITVAGTSFGVSAEITDGSIEASYKLGAS